MKRKIVITFTLILLTVNTGCMQVELKPDDSNKNIESVSLMNFGEYKNIKLNQIVSVEYIEMTEGGSQVNKITDKEEIIGIYNKLSNFKVGEETNKSCDDNTKKYVFNMNDGSSISIEIECDWIVLNNKRYEIK